MRGRHRSAIALAILCAGCAGLPPKHAPVALPAAAPLDGFEAAGGGDWPAQEWWKRYQDPTLDRLIELAAGLLADLGHRPCPLRFGAPVGAHRGRGVRGARGRQC